jgi:hypothetical protein
MQTAMSKPATEYFGVYDGNDLCKISLSAGLNGLTNELA